MKKARKFAIALFLLSLAIAACSAPSPVATETSIPAAPATETPAPTATATPEPSPSPTSSPQLEVLEWYRWTNPAQPDLDEDSAFVAFLVRNPYDFPVAIYHPSIRLINSAGEIVLRTSDVDFFIFADAGWNQMLPGETVPAFFCACLSGLISEIPEWETFELVADVEEATPIAYTTELEISTGDFEHRSTGFAGDQNYIDAQGAVKNTSDQSLKTILLRVTVRDQNGHYVGSGLIGVIGDFFDGKYESLEPGTSYDFWISAFLDPALADQPLEFEVTGFGIVAKE